MVRLFLLRCQDQVFSFLNRHCMLPSNAIPITTPAGIPSAKDIVRPKGKIIASSITIIMYIVPSIVDFFIVSLRI
ncbi:unnamed protein product [marine sediment metagenome]|uniref:Uncharacterized protein n=1 Tax=marine sediment metagenome TaxID=412755 RepID=X1MD57_9ZZZZ